MLTSNWCLLQKHEYLAWHKHVSKGSRLAAEYSISNLCRITDGLPMHMSVDLGIKKASAILSFRLDNTFISDGKNWHSWFIDVRLLFYTKSMREPTIPCSVFTTFPKVFFKMPEKAQVKPNHTPKNEADRNFLSLSAKKAKYVNPTTVIIQKFFSPSRDIENKQ